MTQKNTLTQHKADQGVPGRVRFQGRSCYEVESFRVPDTWYRVDLGAGTCGCPDKKIRKGCTEEDCKHLAQVRQFAFDATIAKARKIEISELKTMLLLNSYRPEVEEAILQVINEREQAAHPVPCDFDDPSWAKRKSVRLMGGAMVTTYFPGEVRA